MSEVYLSAQTCHHCSFFCFGRMRSIDLSRDTEQSDNRTQRAGMSAACSVYALAPSMESLVRGSIAAKQQASQTKLLFWTRSILSRLKIAQPDFSRPRARNRMPVAQLSRSGPWQHLLLERLCLVCALRGAIQP